MSFSERIRELRKGKKLSQEQFAELIGVSRQAVGKWEQGEGNYPEADKLILLVAKTGCSLDALFADEIAAARGELSERQRIPPGVIAALQTFAERADALMDEVMGKEN